MEVTCIVCPRGCTVNIAHSGDGYTVSGNGCKRGRDYAISELTRPMRNFSLTLPITGGDADVIAVRTSSPVRRERIADIASAARSLTLSAPVKAGEIIMAGEDGEGDLIAVATVNSREST